MRAAADTNDTSISQVTLSWVDPDGSTDSNTVVALSGGIAENSFTPDQAGEWTVNADFGNGVIIHKTLNVSALVIPESPIGIIALIVSSLGVLGGFMFLRRNSSTSQSYSLGNLER